MIIISGQTYSTIIDAAGELGVSAKTIREYIAKKIIPPPPPLSSSASERSTIFPRTIWS